MWNSTVWGWYKLLIAECEIVLIPRPETTSLGTRLCLGMVPIIDSRMWSRHRDVWVDEDSILESANWVYLPIRQENHQTYSYTVHSNDQFNTVYKVPIGSIY